VVGGDGIDALPDVVPGLRAPGRLAALGLVEREPDPLADGGRAVPEDLAGVGPEAERLERVGHGAWVAPQCTTFCTSYSGTVAGTLETDPRAAWGRPVFGGRVADLQGG
jgi:hypothetical protein